jgi:tripartite ATP-independent transporter DctM subunit
MSVELLTILIFASLLVFLALGLPIAFSMGAIGILFCLFAWHPAFTWRLYYDFISAITDFNYLPIPLFIFMATMLESSGVAEDLYTMMYNWIGRFAGGLAMGTVFICAILAALVGLSGVTCVTMGIFALPAMLKRGYHSSIAVGSIAAGGTLGILIPPSVLMIIYAIQVGASPAKLFLAGYVVGGVLSILFILYIAIRTRLQPQLGPPVPKEERASWKEKFVSLRAVILPIFLITVVVVTIFGGIGTVTESAAIGAAGSIVCAAVNRKLTWQKIKAVNYETLKLTCMIMFILAGAMTFTRAFVVVGSMHYLQGVFLAMPFGKWGFFILIQVVFLILGCFLDPFGIILITAPAFVPAITAFGFDPVWFGITFIISMEMAYITPPVGLNLFYMKSVAPPSVTTADIYRSIVPFVLIQILMLVVLVVFPQLAMWLPNLVSKH